MNKEYLYKTITKIPIYGGNLIVIFSNSVGKVKEMLSDFKGSSVYAHAYHGGFKGKNSYFVIINPEIQEKDKLGFHGSIAHESLHVVNFLFSHIGEIHSTEHDEPQAYLLGWVVEQVYKILDKYKTELNCNP